MPSKRRELMELAGHLAPRQGYNPTPLQGVRILRSEAILQDVPVLYKPGAAFVLQGRKQGVLDGEIYLYDEQHYLAVSVPVPFRMESVASPERPLLAVYVEFDMHMAAEIASDVETRRSDTSAGRMRGLVSSRMEPDIEDVVLRMLRAGVINLISAGRGWPIAMMFRRGFQSPRSIPPWHCGGERGSPERIVLSGAGQRDCG